MSRWRRPSRCCRPRPRGSAGGLALESDSVLPRDAPRQAPIPPPPPSRAPPPPPCAGWGSGRGRASARPKDDRALHRVLQLPARCRPGVREAGGPGPRRRCPSGLAVRLPVLRRKWWASSGSPGPLAHRRDVDLDHVQAVEEVLPEAASSSRFFRSRWVAATMRTSTLRSCSRPRARTPAPPGSAAA